MAIVTAIALAALAITALLFGVRSALVDSDVYQDALARARADREIIALIGEPMTESFMPAGNINTSTLGGGSGEASLMVTLTGPKGEGTLYVEAKRKRGQWRYGSLFFIKATDDGRVTLVDPATGLGEPAIAP
ncbi:cytochrome c oxidase assembly factor Coa1 family protein [Luteimonas sp. TWI1416]|uniref:cytochrome c oxidase assembly factor Coa1 family protein n=1 Tax=unclassified Luteimonas TaxID=2629088 RepID=UPI003207D437